MSGSSQKATTTTSGGTGGGMTTQVNQTQPWQPVQGAITQGVGDAMAAYGSGVGSQPFLSNMVIPFAQQTTQAMNQTEDFANAANPGFKSADHATAAAAARPVDQWSEESVNRMRGIAAGDMLSGNPHLDDLISRSSSDIVGANKMAAMAGGRSGSGGYQGVMNKSVGDMSSRMRAEDYARERGYMEAANRDVYNAGETRRNNIINAPGQMASAFDSAMKPQEALMGVGGMYEDLATRTKNEELRQWEAKQNQPWNQLGRLFGILNPVAGMGGTTTSTGTTQNTESNTSRAVSPQASRISQIIGGAVGGSQLGWPGAIGGGLLGAFQ